MKKFILLLLLIPNLVIGEEVTTGNLIDNNFGGNWSPQSTNSLSNHNGNNIIAGYDDKFVQHDSISLSDDAEMTEAQIQHGWSSEFGTKNLINLDLLKTMKKNCILINAARGGIINENDLSEALNKNYIFGAGLDVFNNEPPEKNNPLLKSNKVFLSPHTATFTEECAERMGIETIQNIIDFFDKKLEKFRTVIL